MVYRTEHLIFTRCTSSPILPIEGFYVCGASVYPGGMIIGGSGHIGANTIADDMGVKKNWSEPACVTRTRELGFVSEFF